MNLTEKAVSKLTANHERQHFYDDKLDGFGVRIESIKGGGRTSFFWRRKVNGDAIFRSIGAVHSITLKDARDAAQRLNRILQEWKERQYAEPSPFAKLPKAVSLTATTVPTFEQLVNTYCINHVRPHANRPEKAECYVHWLVKKYFASWKTRPVDSITIDEVLTVRNGLAERGKLHQANRCTEFIRALYNWSSAVADKKINFWKVENPAKDVKCYDEEPRERFLQPEELARFNVCLQEETHRDLRDFLTLAITTAARRSDILSMKWSDLVGN
jgi:hypothetical protein